MFFLISSMQEEDFTTSTALTALTDDCVGKLLVGVVVLVFCHTVLPIQPSTYDFGKLLFSMS